MIITIHRGTHEIGGSCVEIQQGETRIIMDVGMPLADKSGERFDFKPFRSLSCRELVEKGILPNVPGLYPCSSDENKIDAIIISHSHMDHFGFVHYSGKNIPVYMGEASQRLIEVSSAYMGQPEIENKILHFKNLSSFNVGELYITPYIVDHSAFDAYAFAIEDGTKKVIYSGDFRTHGRKPWAFKSLLKNAPKETDALILEGTVLGREKEATKSEQELEKEIAEQVRDSDKMVLFYCSGQNIDRLVTFYRAALRSGRLFVIDPYTALILHKLKHFAKIPYPSTEFEKLKILFSYRISRRLKQVFGEETLWKFKHSKITKEEISEEPNKIMMLTRSSMIRDLSRIENIEKSIFIYSLWEGYLEYESMTPLLEFVNEKEMTFLKIHSSGHATIDTLKKALEKLKPKKVIPIHTFHPEAFENMHPETILLNDGQAFHL